MSCTREQRRFFEVVFASIIRNASNADPVPVSGLEYTSHMRQLDAEGRIVDPYSLFEVAVGKALNGASAFHGSIPKGVRASALVGDAVSIGEHIGKDVDLILTSPPYHGAVDYYRRHKLEHCWLGLTETEEDRHRLLGSYIGRPKVPQSDRFVSDGVLRTALRRNGKPECVRSCQRGLMPLTLHECNVVCLRRNGRSSPDGRRSPLRRGSQFVERFGNTDH